MKTKGNFLQLLTREEVKRIHFASLNVLERTGVEVQSRDLLEMLKDAGANVDFKKQRVRFPHDLIERSVKKAPDVFKWHGRDSNYCVTMGEREVNFAPASSNVFVLDTNGTRRRATIKDCEQFSKVVDACELLFEGNCVVWPSDVPQRSAHAHMILAIARNSKKCLRGRNVGREESIECIRMAEVMAGGKKAFEKKPNIITIFNPLSPLIFPKTTLPGFIEYIKHRIPTVVAPEVQAGGTGPITLAGTITLHNAEVLAGFTMAQILNPGVPVMYGSVTTILDMRTATTAYGAIEKGIMDTCFAQMARFYKVPSRTASGTSDSCTLDAQAGFETGLNIQMAALAGVNYIRDAAGSLEGTLTGSLEKVIIDHEIIGMIARVLQGVKINQETLGIDVIDKVGPGGEYLTEEHTLRYLRTEHFMGRLLNRAGFEGWMNRGRKEIQTRAHEAVKHILLTHTPEPLDKKMEEELIKIVKSADKRVEGR